MSERRRTAEGQRDTMSTAAHAASHGRPASRAPRIDDLSLCPSCGRDLVHPLHWEPAGDATWSVSLRCPECEWRGSGVYGQDVIDRFDATLDDGTQAVLDDLELLAKANMQEQADLFAQALANDQILPEDF